MSIFSLDTGKKIYDFKLDVGTISSMSGKHYHKQLFYSFCSFLTPNLIYKVDFQGNEIKETVSSCNVLDFIITSWISIFQLFHETKVGDFDASLYETKQVFYKSKDGTEIPMFIVNKKVRHFVTSFKSINQIKSDSVINWLLVIKWQSKYISVDYTIILIFQLR